MKNRRVFISGGAGVIGRTLVQHLLRAEAQVWVGDLKARPADFPPSVRYRQGDLNTLTPAEVADFAPEVFFHLAATFERSVETYDFWAENYRHNIQLSNHLMTLLKDIGSLERVVFASSYLIYDPQLYLRSTPASEGASMRESDAVLPRNICGAAKLLHEIELRFLQEFPQVAFTAACARIYRVYGRNSRDVVSRWVRALLNDEKLQVFAKEGMFDYIFSDDVAEGLIRLGASDYQGIVNLGRGHARPVSDVLAILGQHFPHMAYEEQESNLPYECSQADMTLFDRVVGWAPSTNLEEGIAELVAFERGALDGAQFIPAVEPTVLVTSSGAKVPLIRALQTAAAKISTDSKVLGADLDADCLSRHFVHGFWNMPRLDALPEGDLLDHCRAERINAIVPTRDGELEYFAGARPGLEKGGVHVMISPPGTVSKCLDKLLFCTTLQGLDAPVIDTASDIAALDGERFVVKERFGAGSRGMGLNLPREQAKAWGQDLDNPIFQPWIEGREFSIDVYVGRNGRAKGAIVRQRVLVVAGESQITRTQRHKGLEQLCSTLSETLGVYGHCVWQVLEDAVGGLHIIECNCRYGGASNLSLKAGLDSFYWFLLEAQGVDVSDYPFFRSRQDLQQVRFAQDTYVIP